MQALKIPKCIIKQIDKLPRKFLWKGNETCKGINCLVNWDRTCALKENGGLGLINLAIQNEALLLKWLWKIQAEPQTHWAQTLRILYRISDVSQIIAQSFFLQSLADLKPFLGCAVQLQQNTNLVLWRWTAHSEFTSASAYKRLHDRGTQCKYQGVLWKVKAPTKVITFIWLLIQDKILTEQVMVKRGCNVNPECVLCASTDLENREHLFAECNYSANFWRGLTAQMNIPIQTQGHTIVDIWWENRPLSTMPLQRLRDTMWVAGCWVLW